MNKEELEKFKVVVINMHISAFLFLCITFPPLIVAYHKIPPTLLGGYFIVCFISIYNFVRQTQYLKANPQYYKTKNRFIYEIVSYIGCCVVAFAIGITPIFYQASGAINILIIIAKVIFGIYSVVSMSISMASAHRLNKLAVEYLKK